MNEGKAPSGGLMRALVYADRGVVVELRDVPRPVAGPAEALVRVQPCGICGSELESFRNRSPLRTTRIVLGHEFCGTVESAFLENLARARLEKAGEHADEGRLAGGLYCEVALGIYRYPLPVRKMLEDMPESG